MQVLVQSLKKQGLSPFKKNTQGRTLYKWGQTWGNASFSAKFKKQGLSPFKENIQGRTLIKLKSNNSVH